MFAIYKRAVADVEPFEYLPGAEELTPGSAAKVASGVLAKCAAADKPAYIIAGAKRESEALIKKAEERARILVGEQEVVRAAQQRAAEIVSTAQTQAREMRQTVTEYCDNMLRASEEQLVRSAAEVKNVRSNLRQAAKNG